jgi:casein kinase 1
MVLSPQSALVKGASRRPGPEPRTTSRDLSNAAIPPASRRQSQQQSRTDRHPYAAAPTSPSGYRTDAYGRTSLVGPSTPAGPPNGALNTGMNGSASGLPQTNVPSDGYMYGGQSQAPATPRAASREGTMVQPSANGPQGLVGARGMDMYDGARMEPVGEQDEGHGRKKGFWGMLCCRA